VIKIFPSTIQTKWEEDQDVEDKTYKKQERKNKKTKAVPYKKDNLEMIGREIGIYLSVDSWFVMPAVGIGITNKNYDLCVVMEKMDCTLAEKIADGYKDGKTYEEWKIWYYFMQVCWGVEFMHQAFIIHMDIKADNVLVKGRTARITDYTLSI